MRSSRTRLFITLILALFIFTNGLAGVNTLELANSGVGGTGTQLNHDGGIGGTGSPQASDGGIGGTGSRHVNDGGIGGTGSKLAQDGGIGGTGIVGAITTLASLSVNNLDMAYDAAVPVTIDGEPSSMNQLSVGQVAVIRAEKEGDKTVARHIAVIHAVVGPIEHIHRDNRTITVLNQRIHLHQDTAITAFNTGQWVQVSGYRSGNSVVATRIDTIRAQTEARINGHITHIDAHNKFLINGTPVVLGQSLQIPPLKKGMEIAVRGQWANGILTVHHVQLNPTQQNIGQVSDIVVRGFWRTIRDSWAVDLNIHGSDKLTNSISGDELVTAYGLLDEAQHIISDSLDIQEIIELNDQYELQIFEQELDALELHNHFDTELEDQVLFDSEIENLENLNIQDSDLFNDIELQNELESIDMLNDIESLEQIDDTLPEDIESFENSLPPGFSDE